MDNQFGQDNNDQQFNNQNTYNGQQGSYNGQNVYNNQNPYGSQAPSPQQGQPYGQIPNMNAQENGQPIPPAGYMYTNGINTNQYMQTQMYPPNEEPQSGYAVASLILGILGILLSCCYGLGFIVGVISVVLAIFSSGTTNGRFTSVAIGGLVCGIVAVAIGIFSFLGFLFLTTL